MPRILCVEDDQTMRELLREHLQDAYEIIETSDASEAIALALQHKPDCILLDLMLPESSGFELCQILSFLNVTQLIPILVITGQPAEDYKEFCLNFGATDYFQKPVDLTGLRRRVDSAVGRKPPERRSETRVRLSVALKLSGLDVSGKKFEALTATDDVSASGFSTSCMVPLAKDALVEVFMRGAGERYSGRARVARIEWRDTSWQRYGFQFIEKSNQWVL